MLQSTEKYISVINRRIIEASSETANSYSIKQLSLILGVKRATIKKWITEGAPLPDWALQKLHILPNNSGFIRSLGKIRKAPTFFSSLYYCPDSIVTKSRRDGSLMDIPATQVPRYITPTYSLLDYFALARKGVYRASESFLSTLAAVGRKDKEEIRP
ncbi:MAG TPA: hypothetical protein PLD45_04585 [Spirochaetales bacterium]|jgi:hypothetical protein|nr:hypothetical protein [Spirochaetales bacterium]